MVHLIKKIEEVVPYKIKVKFNTGETREIDLEEKLKEWSKTPGSIYKKLLDPGYFKKVKLNTEMETIYWENGIDFCPDVLYSMGRV